MGNSGKWQLLANVQCHEIVLKIRLKSQITYVM